MTAARAFARQSIGWAFTQYLARAALLARGLVAAVVLGPAGYGGWNALNLILDYGAYASLGVIYGLDVALPGWVERGDRARATWLCRSAWTWTLGGGLLFAAGAIALRAVGMTALDGPWGPGPQALMLVAALLQLTIAYVMSVLRANGRIPAVSAGGAIQAVLGGLLGIALVGRLGVWGLIGAWIFGQITALLWMGRAGVAIPLRPTAHPEAKALLLTGLPIFGCFLASLVLRSADRLAFVHYLGTEPLGYYSVGLMAASLVLYPAEAAGFVLYPRMASAHHGARDQERTRREVLRVHRVLCVFIPIVAGLGVLWAEPVVHGLLPAYAPGVTAMRVLALGSLALSASTVPGYFLLASGHERKALAAALVAAAVSLAVVFTVAARRREGGAIALASASGYAFFALLILALAARVLWPAARARVAFVAASVGPALWGGTLAFGLRAAPGAPALATVLPSCLFLLAYAPMLWLVRNTGLRALIHPPAQAPSSPHSA